MGSKELCGGWRAFPWVRTLLQGGRQAWKGRPGRNYCCTFCAGCFAMSSLLRFHLDLDTRTLHRKNMSTCTWKLLHVTLLPSRVCWNIYFQWKCSFLFHVYGVQLIDNELDFGRLGKGEKESRLTRNLFFFLISPVKAITIHLDLYE